MFITTLAVFIYGVVTQVNLHCEDSDFGVNYYQAGEVSVVKTDGNKQVYTDYCSNAQGSQITEYSCGLNKTLQTKIFTCQAGCYDGRCLMPVSSGSTGCYLEITFNVFRPNAKTKLSHSSSSSSAASVEQINLKEISSFTGNYFEHLETFNEESHNYRIEMLDAKRKVEYTGGGTALGLLFADAVSETTGQFRGTVFPQTYTTLSVLVPFNSSYKSIKLTSLDGNKVSYFSVPTKKLKCENCLLAGEKGIYGVNKCCSNLYMYSEKTGLFTCSYCQNKLSFKRGADCKDLLNLQYPADKIE